MSDDSHFLQSLSVELTNSGKSYYGTRCHEIAAEIERLTAALREYACTATDHPCGCYNQFLSERAEIERLTKERDFARAERRAVLVERIIADACRKHVIPLSATDIGILARAVVYERRTLEGMK